MRPVLLQLGEFRLYSYGAFIALGGFFAVWYWKARRAAMGLKKEDDLWLLVNVILIGGFLGGRLLYLAEYVHSDDLWTAAFTFNRGFSVLGAFAGVPAAVWLFCRARKVAFLPVLDHVSVGAALWHFFGRLGCFMAGCCFGRECELPWAVTFTDPRALAPMGVPVHPSQLYEAAGSLLLFFALRPLPARLPPGATAGAYFVSYGCLRAVYELFRGDAVRPEGWPLTAGQALSLVLVAVGVLLCIRSYSKPARSS